jgi:hypothetical protein
MFKIEAVWEMIENYRFGHALRCIHAPNAADGGAKMNFLWRKNIRRDRLFHLRRR